MKVVIRPLRIQDVDDCRAIISGIFEGEERALNMQALPLDMADMWSNANVKPTFFVAKSEREIVGFVGIKESVIDWGVFQIYWLMVDPTHQRQKIGRSLMYHAMGEITKKGGTLVILSTPVPKYFHQFGFKKFRTHNLHTVMSLQS